MNLIIFTTGAGEGQIALNELAMLYKNCTLEKWLGNGVGLLRVAEDKETFISRLLENPPVFIRHVCQVDVFFQTPEKERFSDTIVENIQTLVCSIKKDKSFSVQTRVFSKSEEGYQVSEINRLVSDFFIEKGYNLNINEPEQIFSVTITDDCVYLGVSESKCNLSNWAGGAIRFYKEDGQISRAELKLLEALKTFEIELPPNGSCLDLGAAPGGFTRVLRNLGQRVVAVDPAELHVSLLKDKMIIHEKTTAQYYFKNIGNERFDLITNDMKMDVNESIDIMISAKPYLKDDGIGIITLKLPQNNKQKLAYKAINVLKKHFKIIGARQLFHNRSEVTVVFQNML